MNGDALPRVGEIRAALVEEGLGWRVSPFLSDEDRPPRFSQGSSREGIPLAAEVPAVDFQDVLAEPVRNPLLTQRRIDLGFIPTDSTTGLGTETIMDTSQPQTAGVAATQVDWRSRWGWPWITTIRDQNGCNACWVFTAVALVEAMTRIEHCVWTERSDGDVHKGIAAVCASTGDFANAVEFIRTDGVSDPVCFPWTVADITYTPSIDRSGRTVEFDKKHWVGSTSDQKKWLDTVGPLATHFRVRSDFLAYGVGVYEPTATATGSAGHDMLVVGYDDIQGCWIVKNSWGTGWGENGFVRIKYGVCDIDKHAKQGVAGTDPDPLTRRRLHNGCLFESGQGSEHRDFELLAKDGAELQEWRRDGSHPYPWNTGSRFAADVASFPTYTSTTFDRNFEAIYVTDADRLHHWWYGRGDHQWHDGGVFGPNDATGMPGFIQGNYGKPANFEVVVGTSTGQFNHWWRAGGMWHDGGRHGQDISRVGPGLVQGRGGKNGTLELVVVLGDSRLQHWWRNDDEQFAWSIRHTFSEDGYFSAPCMIEGQYGAGDERSAGNYELCVVRGNKIEHWWRWNGGDQQWRRSTTFGSDAKDVVGMVEGSWGFNLELVVLRTDGRLQHYWRDGNGWHAGGIFA